MPVFLQATEFNAVWMLVVSSEPAAGGEERWDVLNCACSTLQTAGYVGWVTVRESPVA
jgi:hypothetical protein